MAILSIIEAPDKALRTISKPVKKVDDDVRRLMDDMLETMYAAPGVGLAAIQVGEAKRVIVMDISRDEDKPAPRYFINPEVLWASEDMANYNEGCLSVPEHYADVERPVACRLRYLDYEGEIREEDMDGMLATCIQHEIDHLNGILFIDHLSTLKRQMILKKLRKTQKAEATA